MPIPRVLVIAGSDSSGGAGLEADQKVLAAHACYAMTATTALTAQNTLGVRDIYPIPAEFVEKQIVTNIEDIGVDVVKTGMLASKATIETVSRLAKTYSLSPLVIDPVMVSSAGEQATLLPASAISTLITQLLPQTTILTPNLPEAQLIQRHAGASTPVAEDVEDFGVRSVEDLERLGKQIQGLGPKWVLVKGGHLPFTKKGEVAQSEEEKELIVDVLVGPDNELLRMESDYVRSRHTHGTGCSLASAIAANLGKGMDVPSAVKLARKYVEAGIRTAPKLGEGNGPLNHFHSLSPLPFSSGNFLDYLLDRADMRPVWDEYVTHPFVRALQDGSLPIESFKGYIIQDYLFLIHFARAYALMAFKSTKPEEIKKANEIAGHIVRETSLHINYCESFGITKEELEATEEHPACTAYTRFVLDTGCSSDILALRMALAPCSIGYAVIGKRLNESSRTKREGNPYWRWIETYASEDYVAGVEKSSGELEEGVQLQSAHRIEELVKVFRHATKMEISFWEMFPHK